MFEWLSESASWARHRIVDEYHFMRQMGSQMFGDNSYTPPYAREAAAKTQEGRDKQLAEGKRYTESVQNIAKDFETAAATVIMAPEMISTAGTSLVARGGAKLGIKGVLKKAGRLGEGSLTFSEDIANNILKERGEAPLLSPIARWVPWLGDKHYQAGGHEWNHPDRPATGSGNRGIVNPMEMARGVKNTAVDFVDDIASLPSTARHLMQRFSQAKAQAAYDNSFAADISYQEQSGRNKGVVAVIGSTVGSLMGLVIGILKFVLTSIASLIMWPFNRSSLNVAVNKNTPPTSSYASNTSAIAQPEVPALHASPAVQPNATMGRG